MYELISGVLDETRDPEVRKLADEVSSLTSVLLKSEIDDRLAAGMVGEAEGDLSFSHVGSFQRF